MLFHMYHVSSSLQGHLVFFFFFFFLHFFLSFMEYFLDAFSYLHKRVCPSVRPHLLDVEIVKIRHLIGHISYLNQKMENIFFLQNERP